MPTFTAGLNAKVLVNGNDLSSYFKAASATASSDTTETTAFNDTAKKYVATLKDGTFTADGMLQSGTTTIDGVLTAALGVDGTELTYFPAGDANAALGVGLQGADTSHQVASPVDGVSTVSMSLQATQGAEPLLGGHAWSAVTAAGTSASIDNVAASTVGAVSYLHAQVTGGTLVVKLQDSPDNITFTDRITHATVPAGTASERATLSGTIARYTHYVWTLNGGTALFQSAVGRIPNL